MTSTQPDSSRPRTGLRRFCHANGLSIVFMGLFAVSLVGHALSGVREFNAEQKSHGRPAVSLGGYLRSGDFIESVFENWESEFLQMGAFVLLSAMLFQKGSPESKPMDDEAGEHPTDEDPRTKRDDPDAPAPVHRGGLALTVYSHSLSLSLFLLFAISFVLHAVGGAKDWNLERSVHGESPVSLLSYLGTSRFWFESFQNWQSEFLSVGVLVLLSVVFREKGSSQSKPVAAPHKKTGV